MSDSVIFKFGADTSAVGQALRGLTNQVEQFRTQAVNKFKGIEEGMKWFARANMMLALIGQFDQIADKTRELAQWWGAFSVGGVKAVEAMGQEEAELERNRQKYKELNRKRWKEEADAAKALIDLKKSMRDIVYANATDEGKLNILQKERNELYQAFIKTEAESADHHKALQAYMEKEQQIREANLAIEKKKTEEAEKQKKLAKDIADARDNVKNAANALEDRSRVTMDELLNGKTGKGLRGDQAKAGKAAEMQKKADALRLNGDFEGSEQLLTERDELIREGEDSPAARYQRKYIDALKKQSGGRSNKTIDGLEKDFQDRYGGINSLKSSERDENAAMLKTLNQANEKLLELIKQQGGLPVKAKMGK